MQSEDLSKYLGPYTAIRETVPLRIQNTFRNSNLNRPPALAGFTYVNFLSPPFRPFTFLILFYFCACPNLATSH
jgi:hypothetical protein